MVSYYWYYRWLYEIWILVLTLHWSGHGKNVGPYLTRFEFASKIFGPTPKLTDPKDAMEIDTLIEYRQRCWIEAKEKQWAFKLAVRDRQLKKFRRSTQPDKYADRDAFQRYKAMSFDHSLAYDPRIIIKGYS